MSNTPTHDQLLHRIKELEQAEERRRLNDLALSKDSEKYRALFDHLQETVIIYRVVRDAQGRIIDWIFDDCNIAARKALGGLLENSVGKRTSQLFGEKIMAEYIQRSRRVDKTRKAESFETYFSFNQRYYYSTVFFISRDLYVNVSEDVTEKKRAEKERIALQDQLSQAQKMEAIGTLSGGIAHDFNNILFPIIGYTELLLDRGSFDDSTVRSLRAILESALRAKDLVRQILRFSSRETEGMKVMMIQPLVKESMKMMRATIPSTIKIVQDVDPGCGPIKADPTMLHQVIMNLVTNAYHAMEDTGGEIKLCLRERWLADRDLTEPGMMPGHYACLSILDTGIGMEKQVMDKVFDPFYTTKEKGKGTGLGLSVVHGIISNLGGMIMARSKPGVGTEFDVYFPLEKKGLDNPPPKEGKAAPQGSEHLLIVDDELPIIKMTTRMLKGLGYGVSSFTSSRKALEAFRSDPDRFDLVITDMAMPQIPGDLLVKELAAIRPDLPIIVCTGFTDRAKEERLRTAGIRHLLVKPVLMSDLAVTIRKVLDRA